MSDYKLVPRSIVDELAQFIRKVDGNNKMGAGALAEKICERFRVDVAAVQGEPVGEVRLELGAQPYVFAELYSKSLSILAPGTKLYAAPQPAEQQPAPDVARLVEALEKIAAFQPKDILCGSGWKEWNRAGEYAASIARDALAAHRKQGGEV